MKFLPNWKIKRYFVALIFSRSFKDFKISELSVAASSHVTDRCKIGTICYNKSFHPFFISWNEQCSMNIPDKYFILNSFSSFNLAEILWNILYTLVESFPTVSVALPRGCLFIVQNTVLCPTTKISFSQTEENFLRHSELYILSKYGCCHIALSGA